MATPIALLSSLCLGLALFATPGLTQPTATSPATQIAQETPDLDQMVQRFTVQVMTDRNRGSGTLLAQKKGNIYLVLTNLHVVRGSQTVQVKTFDGKQYKARVLDHRFTTENDLALLEFTSATAYKTPDIAKATPQMGWSLLSGGYGASSGKFQLSRGQLKQVPSKMLKEGYQLGYSGTIEQGMSGGPIFEAESLELVGINGRSAFPIVSNYPSEKGTPPSAVEVQEMRQLNWGLSIQGVLTQVDETIAAAYGFPPPADSTDIQAPQMTGWLAKLESNAKQVTVSIDSVGSHGSGVIVSRQGSTYTVLTAYHVVACASDSSGCQYTVMTHDGQQYSVVPSSIIRREGVDLAVVQFNSNTTYPRATLANYNPQNQDYVFVAGHPQRKDQWLWSGGRVYEKEQGVFTITKTSLSEKASLPPGQQITAQAVSFDGGYELVYTSITYGGMSGEGVFDSQGRMIGIHGQAEGETGEEGRDIQLGNSLGIPASTVVGLLPQFQLTAGQVSITEQPSQALTTEQLSNLENALLSMKVSRTNASANVWIERGGQLLRLQRYGEAEQAFEKAIQVATPAIVHSAHYGKGVALASQEQWGSAIQSLETALKTKPNYVPAMYYLAIWHRELEQYDRALAAIERAIRQQTKGRRQNSFYYNEKWVILDKLQRHIDALAAIEKAIDIAPRAAFYLHRGNTYNRLQQYDKAISDYTQAIQINPKLAIPYHNRGNTYNRLQQYDKAISDYTQAIQISPKYAEAYGGRGTTHDTLQQYDKAISDYTQAIQINPKLAIPYHNRGNTYNRLQQYDKAISDYTQAIQINPKYALAYFNRGSVYNVLQQYEKAISDYTQAIQINPKYAEAYFNRGLVYSTPQQYEKAISDFTQAIQINPKFAKAYAGRGFVYNVLQQYDKAISDFTQAIQINPKFAEAYYGRGLSYHVLQQYEKALSDYNTVLNINPKQVDVILNIGSLQYEQGSLDSALSQFQKVLAINNTSAEAKLALAVALHQQGNTTQALELAKAALTAEPKFANPEFQRKNLWGAKLIADTQKLLSNPALQTATQKAKP
jgi:tetratricopeptide (TPR) repeat protein